MPFPGIVAHYLDLAQGQIEEAFHPELRPQEPPVNSIREYFRSRWGFPETPVTVDDVISTQLAFFMMPAAALVGHGALLPGGRGALLGGREVVPGGRGAVPGYLGGFSLWQFIFKTIVFFMIASFLVILFSFMGVIFVVCLYGGLTWLVGGYIFRRFASRYRQLRGWGTAFSGWMSLIPGYGVPLTETRGRRRTRSVTDELLEQCEEPGNPPVPKISSLDRVIQAAVDRTFRDWERRKENPTGGATNHADVPTVPITTAEDFEYEEIDACCPPARILNIPSVTDLISPNPSSSGSVIDDHHPMYLSTHSMPPKRHFSIGPSNSSASSVDGEDAMPTPAHSREPPDLEPKEYCNGRA